MDIPLHTSFIFAAAFLCLSQMLLHDQRGRKFLMNSRWSSLERFSTYSWFLFMNTVHFLLTTQRKLSKLSSFSMSFYQKPFFHTLNNLLHKITLDDVHEWESFKIMVDAGLSFPKTQSFVFLCMFNPVLNFNPLMHSRVILVFH